MTPRAVHPLSGQPQSSATKRGKGANLDYHARVSALFLAVLTMAFNPSSNHAPVMFQGSSGFSGSFPQRGRASPNKLAKFWGLMGLLISTTLALCVLISMTLNRALAPAAVIVAGLEKMRTGELSARLAATFQLQDGEKQGAAITSWWRGKKDCCPSDNKLALQLMTRRRVVLSGTRLHDEFGQSCGDQCPCCIHYPNSRTGVPCHRAGKRKH